MLDFSRLFYWSFSTNIQILCGRSDSDAPRSDTPHKVARYLFYYSAWLSRWFPPDQYNQVEMIVPVRYQLLNGKSAGLAVEFVFLSWVLNTLEYFSNECEFSAESSLHGISSNSSGVVKMKRFVSSNVNVILTQQTCGQCSCMSAGSKCRVLENYFYEQICYMLLKSECRGDWDVGLCACWILAKRAPLHNAKFRFFLRAKQVFFRKSPLRSCSLFASIQKEHSSRT